MLSTDEGESYAGSPPLLLLPHPRPVTSKEGHSSQCRNVGVSGVKEEGLHQGRCSGGREGRQWGPLLSACSGEAMRALGCCFLGDIGAGPGPGLQKEARACVRGPEGGVRGMGEEGPLLSSVLGGPDV